MWMYWVPRNLQLLVKIARFMWISPQLKRKQKESRMTLKESPPNQEPWSPGPYCSPSVGVGGTGWASHLELQLLGLFRKLQSTASPQHCRVKPQHWVMGSVPWLVTSGLPTGVWAPWGSSHVLPLLSSGQGLTLGMWWSPQASSCSQGLLSWWASQGRATASLAELIVELSCM